MVNNSTYLASGSHDGQVMIWDVIQGKWLTSYEYDSPINCVLFSQKLYWVIIGTEEGIKVFDLPSSRNIQEIKETSMLANECAALESAGANNMSEPPSTSLALPSPGTSPTTNSTPVSPITSSESTRLTRSPTERIAESRRLTPLLVAFSIITFDTYSSIKHSII